MGDDEVERAQLAQGSDVADFELDVRKPLSCNLFEPCGDLQLREVDELEVTQ